MYSWTYQNSFVAVVCNRRGESWPNPPFGTSLSNIWLNGIQSRSSCGRPWFPCRLMRTVKSGLSARRRERGTKGTHHEIVASLGEPCILDEPRHPNRFLELVPEYLCPMISPTLDISFQSLLDVPRRDPQDTKNGRVEGVRRDPGDDGEAHRLEVFLHRRCLWAFVRDGNQDLQVRIHEPTFDHLPHGFHCRPAWKR